MEQIVKETKFCALPNGKCLTREIKADFDPEIDCVRCKWYYDLKPLLEGVGDN